ncbi:hypothetical protein BCR32DRAFT_266924 [Anaeromyces robustus]|uniref:F-box domain-containing protein n=1 Tax=Anaeromyces robustus TaxID=1754192 RepID=A0A1Y1XCT0_9FUNG|nr:hypothetical protein BCR32DRAFT_266924 [Anaeromyces robustus]|eukprot:ORX83548.1 hypothetical protein BCR32DRAFT_266924 [Anaeromyces robustus]
MHIYYTIVNQIPNEILIKVFINPLFNQNDYYKFCLVCRSWNQAATIVLWNCPYIYSFRQLVKFYQCLLYNEKILNELEETRIIDNEKKGRISSSSPQWINHNLSKLVNKLDLTRVRLERPISNRQRTELYKALNILGDKLMPSLNSLSICREQYLNYKSITSLLRNLKKFNYMETLYISIALFQSWKEWNHNNHLNHYLIFPKMIENLKSPHLKKIRLQNCCDLNDEACYQLFDKCTEINELEILGSSNVSIDVLYYSLKMLKDLKFFSYTAIATPQFTLNNNIDENVVNDQMTINNNNDENEEVKLHSKEGSLVIDLNNKPQASNIQIIDINSSGWSPYLNWMFSNQSCHSLKKLILTIQTREEKSTIYKAISSCSSLEELIINYRHEMNENNDTPLANIPLTIDLDKLFLVKTENYQSNIKFLHISGLEIEKSKRFTKYMENIINNNDDNEQEKEEIQSENFKFNKLKYLHLYIPSSKYPIEYILYQFPCLEEFVLNLKSNLKRLSIRSSSFGDGFSDQQINSIIEKCKSVTNLELDCKSLTEDCLCHIIKTLKGKLISLRLERVNRSTINDKFLTCLCQYNPGIQQLEIFAEHGKLEVTYEGTNNIIEQCKNLRYFSLGLEGFNPIIPYYLEQPSNYRSYFKILNYTSKKRFI